MEAALAPLMALAGAVAVLWGSRGSDELRPFAALLAVASLARGTLTAEPQAAGLLGADAAAFVALTALVWRSRRNGIAPALALQGLALTAGLAGWADPALPTALCGRISQGAAAAAGGVLAAGAGLAALDRLLALLTRKRALPEGSARNRASSAVRLT